MGESDCYPVMLRLKGRSCVVVGAGGVARRKVIRLLAAQARVTVISPVLQDPLLRELADAKVIETRMTVYVPGILSDLHPLLVFATTNAPEINRQVAAEARSLCALVDVTNASTDGDFMSMSAFQRGPVTVAISTGGASPALAAHLKEKLESRVGWEYGLLAEWMAEQRGAVKKSVETQAERRDIWKAVLAAPVLDMIRRGDLHTARELFDKLVAIAKSDDE